VQNRQEARKCLQLYRCVFTAVIHTHRSVVDKPNFHHGLENSILDPFRLVEALDLIIEMVVKLPSLFSVRGAMEIRLVAFLDLGVERKLGDWDL
jgi:hypothetical protein